VSHHSQLYGQPVLEVGRVSLLADPPPKCQCLTIRNDFFLLTSTVGGVSTWYPVFG